MCSSKIYVWKVCKTSLYWNNKSKQDICIKLNGHKWGGPD